MAGQSRWPAAFTKTSARRSGRAPALAATAAFLLLVVVVALATNVRVLRGSSAHLSSAGRESIEKQLQELKEAVEQGRKELAKQVQHTGASWVRDADVQQVAKVNAACDSHHNASAGGGLRLDASHPQLVAPVVVLAHARVKYLATTALTLIRHWSSDPANAARFPLFISVDGDHQPTLLFSTSLAEAAGVQVIRVARDDAACPSPFHSYCNLATHYKVLLQLFFECMQAPRLIFVEEDLQVAPDFFDYFAATAPLLDADTSLYCISAWNDHGQAGRASNATALHRTDVFPGLGWLLTRAVGLELLPGWPPGYWDDNHLRKPSVRRGRQCVFPEVPRTHTFGAVGASNGMFYDQHLANMVLNSEAVDYEHMDVSYLQADQYARTFTGWLARSTPLNPILAARNTSLAEYCAPNVTALVDGPSDASDVWVTYQNNAEFEELGRALAPMLASVSGGARIPRGVYNGTGHGAVIVRCRQRRLFLLNRAPE